jgi:hypothetical protein
MALSTEKSELPMQMESSRIRELRSAAAACAKAASCVPAREPISPYDA